MITSLQLDFMYVQLDLSCHLFMQQDDLCHGLIKEANRKLVWSCKFATKVT
jgi:hypothetical protein